MRHLRAVSFLKALTRQEAAPSSIEIEGRNLRVVVREHAAARRLTMRLSPCGEELRLTVPRRTSARAVAAFLERHRDWAGERLASRPASLLVADGAVLPFRGTSLRIVSDPLSRATALHAAGDGTFRLNVGGDPQHLSRRVKDALVREARRDLQAAVERHSAAAGVRPAGLSLKDTRSRWGSCSTSRRLSFSWRIVLAPPAALDYLAAHEVAHLREMNHGPAFWALCRELCPGMDEGKAWLRAHGGALHAIVFP